MPVAVPTVIVQGWGAADPTGRVVVPLAPGGTPGRASYNLGFPPATRLAPEAGGVPPFGTDMNAALFDATGNIAWIQGGMGYTYSSAFSTANTGYAIGAVLRSSVDPMLWWYNSVAGNVTNPDSGGIGWLGFSPLVGFNDVQTVTLAAGTTNNQVINPGVGFLDLNPTSGAATVTSFVPLFNGQECIVTNVHASNPVDLPALTGPTVANQLRSNGTIRLLQNQSQRMKYSSSVSKWVVA